MGGAGLRGATPWAIQHGDVGGNRLELLGYAFTGKVWLFGAAGAPIPVWGLGALAAPLVQAIILVVQGTERPASVEARPPGLFGPHEEPPSFPRWIPRALLGGKPSDTATDEALETPSRGKHEAPACATACHGPAHVVAGG
ncbi:MAG: hypothetical protein AB2A00_25095 [Myxococcota bacterium]